VEGTRPTLGIAFGSNPYLLTTATANYNSLQTNISPTIAMWDVLFGSIFSRSFDNSSASTDRTYPYNPKASYGLSKFDLTHNFVGSYNIRLPFDRFVDNHITKAVIGGWPISGITRFALIRRMVTSDSNGVSSVTNAIPNPSRTKCWISCGVAAEQDM